MDSMINETSQGLRCGEAAIKKRTDSYAFKARAGILPYDVNRTRSRSCARKRELIESGLGPVG